MCLPELIKDLLISHVFPENPALHLHLKSPPAKDSHFPPFLQGLGMQGSKCNQIKHTLVDLIQRQ